MVAADGFFTALHDEGVLFIELERIVHVAFTDMAVVEHAQNDEMLGVKLLGLDEVLKDRQQQLRGEQPQNDQGKCGEGTVCLQPPKNDSREKDGDRIQRQCDRDGCHCRYSKHFGDAPNAPHAVPDAGHHAVLGFSAGFAFLFHGRIRSLSCSLVLCMASGKPDG